MLAELYTHLNNKDIYKYYNKFDTFLKKTWGLLPEVHFGGVGACELLQSGGRSDLK